MEVIFSKWPQSVQNNVMNLFLSISMVYNVLSCRKIAKNTQILAFNVLHGEMFRPVLKI